MKIKKKIVKSKHERIIIDDSDDYNTTELYQYKAKIIKIVDGDTLDADVDMGFGLTMRQRFRINNFDAPETYRPKSEAEKIHGLEAKVRITELLVDKDILLRSTKIPGIYGRFGADIWLDDGRNFVDVMISEGFEKKSEY